MLLDYILSHVGIISLVLIGTIIFYKFDFWGKLGSAISNYWTDGLSIGDILSDGFNAAAYGVVYTKEFLQFL